MDRDTAADGSAEAGEVTVTAAHATAATVAPMVPKNDIAIVFPLLPVSSVVRRQREPVRPRSPRADHGARPTVGKTLRHR
ncbi:hypothetical protein GCM10022243_00500 [Saccharothrix violaceirubra]